MNKRLKHQTLKKYQAIISPYYPSVRLMEWMDNDMEGVVFAACGLYPNEKKDFNRFNFRLLETIAEEQKLPRVTIHPVMAPLI